MGKDESVAIRVRPRAVRAGITVDGEGGIVVRVHAPPSEGAANRECVAVLAKALGVARSRVEIVRGAKGRSKQIVVEGLSAQEVRARLVRHAVRDGRAR